MFKIENNRLMQDGIDVSDLMDATQLKAEGETLLLFAKFKATIEKAAETCFGAPKKRKPRTPKAPTPVFEGDPDRDPKETETLTTHGFVNPPDSPYMTQSDGVVYNKNTGEVL